MQTSPAQAKMTSGIQFSWLTLAIKRDIQDKAAKYHSIIYNILNFIKEDDLPHVHRKHT